MASRVFLLCILFTVGLLTGRSIGTGEPEVTLSFIREPQDVVAVRSKQLVLHCEVASSTSDPVNITWTHDDQPLDLVNDSRRYILHNGSLFFKRVSGKGPDQGSYRCVARNSVGALVSRAARLRVATLAHNFSGSPVNTSVEEDDIARFSCQIESVPEALISWERNGEPLPQSSRYFILESGVLYIARAQQDDAGTYRCTATNLLTKKTKTSKEAELVVKPRSPFPRPPEFLSHLGSAVHVVTARTGDNLTLDCAASGLPTPQLSWSFGKGKLPVAMSQIKSGPGISILPLQNISPHHAGTYTCSAHRDDASLVNQQTVSLDVLIPPTFVKLPTSQFYLTARTVRFECEAQGNPTPDVIWLKNGKQLQINGRIKQRPTELVLSNTVTDDSGLYQCLALNKAGENWVAGRLRVNTSSFQPEPPQGLVCFTRSESQVELQWKEPAKIPDSDISAYTVHYLPTDGGEERQEVSVNRTFVVQKLAAYTNYTFYVRAYSTRSASDQSARIVCQTGEGVPLGAPKPVLEAVSPTTLRVTWSPLSKEKAQGVVTAYKIQWRRRGHPTLRVVEVKGDITDYTITGLHPGKKFDVRVLAATNKGWPEHPEEFQWTPIEMPNYNLRNVPQAPTVHLTSDNSTSVEVKWSLPPENKYKPSGFKLFYRKLHSQQEGPVNLDANVTQYLLGYLEPETWYEVIVRAYNSEGVGEPGVQAIYTLPPSGQRVTGLRDNVTMSLEPPSNLEAEPTSPSSINLTWTPPAMLTSNVSYYTVRYGPVQSSRTINMSIFSYVSSTSPGVEINGLKPYTLYEFMVRTHDHNNRHGPFSQKVECHTLEDVPSAVLDIQWRALNSSSIRVSWKEPHFTNGLINNYLVSITTDFGLPFDGWRSISVPGSRLYTEISGLKPNMHYFIFARAVTRAGMGPLSEMVPVTIPVVTPPGGTPVEPPQQPRDQQPDQHLGIVVGVGIGVGCMVLCAVVIVWRRRCIKMSSPQCPTGPHIAPHHANGNGYYPPSRMMELHELDHFTANIPHEPQPDHLDTKGGYPNGQVNGLKHTRLTNGRIPNGQIVRDKGNNVHITENPQFNNGGGSVNDMIDSQDTSLLASAKSCRTEEDDSDHTTPLLLFRGLETSAKESGSSETGEDSDLNTTRMTELDISLDNSHNHLSRNNHQCTPYEQQQPRHQQNGDSSHSLQHMDNSVATTGTTSTSSPLQAAALQPYNQ